MTTLMLYTRKMLQLPEEEKKAERELIILLIIILIVGIIATGYHW